MQKPWQEIVVMLHSEINCVFQEGIIHLKERGFCPKTLLSLAALQRSLCQKLYDLQVTRYLT